MTIQPPGNSQLTLDLGVVACAEEAHVVGVDVGSPALHDIPTTFVMSSSGQARKSCEGGHISHEEGLIFSQVPFFTPQGAGHDVGRPDSLRHNMVAGVDVTRLDISPNPAPMAAELNLEVRPQPRVGPNRPRRTLRNPLTSSSVNITVRRWTSNSASRSKGRVGR